MNEPGTYPLEPDSTILDAETFTRFGYYATQVSFRGKEKVVQNCTRCNQRIERSRDYATKYKYCKNCLVFIRSENIEIRLKNICSRCGARYKDKCRSCSTKSEPIVNKFLTKPSTAGAKSHTYVELFCSRCSKIFNRQAFAVVEKPVCVECSRFVNIDHAALQAKRRRTFSEKYKDGINWTTSPTGLAQDLFKLAIEEKTKLDFQKEIFIPNTTKRMDIYNPILKLGIEYNGLMWHHDQLGKTELSRSPNRHLIKMQEAEKAGIRLLNFWEDEINAKLPQVLNIISKKCGTNSRRIKARKTQIIQITQEEGNSFLTKYHLINPKKESTLFLAGVFEGETIAVMSFCIKKEEVYLQQYATIFDTYYQGGISKLLHKVISLLSPKKIIYLSDNRLEPAANYTVFGFKFDEDIPTDYDYVKAKSAKYRLSKLSCPPDLTEAQWVEKEGLARLWDCGKKRWVMSL